MTTTACQFDLADAVTCYRYAKDQHDRARFGTVGSQRAYARIARVVEAAAAAGLLAEFLEAIKA